MLIPLGFEIPDTFKSMHTLKKYLKKYGFYLERGDILHRPPRRDDTLEDYPQKTGAILPVYGINPSIFPVLSKSIDEGYIDRRPELEEIFRKLSTSLR